MPFSPSSNPITASCMFRFCLRHRTASAPRAELRATRRCRSQRVAWCQWIDVKASRRRRQHQRTSIGLRRESRPLNGCCRAQSRCSCSRPTTARYEADAASRRRRRCCAIAAAAAASAAASNVQQASSSGSSRQSMAAEDANARTHKRIDTLWAPPVNKRLQAAC